MLENNIIRDLKQALKSAEKVRISVLRMLISEIKNKKIADRTQEKELDDANVLSLVQKMVRQHEESIEKFKEGNRQDLVDKETAELKILKGYMPEPMTEEELARVISDSINSTGAASMKDMGKVMGDVLSRIAGRADGKTVSRIVKEKLAGK